MKNQVIFFLFFYYCVDVIKNQPNRQREVTFTGVMDSLRH
jgi:hypothetical protein